VPGKTLDDLGKEFVKKGMQAGALMGSAMRIVTHLDISAKETALAAHNVIEILDGWK